MESRAGGGSTFWFVLSLPVAEFTHLRPQETKALYSGHTQLKLLLVEDLEVNQELIKAVLEGLGHQIDVASNGAEAIEMIQSVRYDLVLWIFRCLLWTALRQRGQFATLITKAVPYQLSR